MTSDAGTSTSVRSLVVMGVSGSGKSTIARMLAERIEFEFIDADWLHSRQNLEKMAGGHALNDADRLPWLRAVGQRLQDEALQRRGTVTACSALKYEYRDVLRLYVPDAFFIALEGSERVVRARIEARHSAVMPLSLLASQFETFEPLRDGERGMHVDIRFTPDVIVSDVVAQLHLP